MKKFIETNTYKEIMGLEFSKPITIAFYIKTDVFISKDNIDDIILYKIHEYNDKIENVKKIAPDFPTVLNLEEKIREDVQNRLNDYLLELKFVNLTSKENIIDIVNEIEELPEFFQWCVD
jgi:hypothetical protein